MFTPRDESYVEYTTEDHLSFSEAAMWFCLDCGAMLVPCPNGPLPLCRCVDKKHVDEAGREQDHRIVVITPENDRIRVQIFYPKRPTEYAPVV